MYSIVCPFILFNFRANKGFMLLFAFCLNLFDSIDIINLKENKEK